MPGRYPAVTTVPDGAQLDPTTLQEAFARLGWDQMAAAKAAGLSQGTISFALRGIPISLYSIGKIREALRTAGEAA